ncbi:MAG: WbqC family protein [Prolixibacteraceae bacterium]|nr:WbqC family protein [Prolixibacteraceae bacterium]
MLIASHQPYFFPYIGYFSLISAVDKFIFFDIAQFTRKSWMYRNRILKPDRLLDQYINISLIKPEYKIKLPECRINNKREWEIRIFSQLKHYRKVAPFYFETISFLEELFQIKDDLLNEFNIRTIKSILKYLEITTPTLLFSEFNFEYTEVENLWDWALLMCSLLNSDAFLNAPGGLAIYSTDAFRKKNIKLGFIQHKLMPYDQKNQNFIHSLSILDVLMFNGRIETKKKINEFSIKWV